MTLNVYVLVEVDRCPRCFRAGTIIVTGRQAEFLLGLCTGCEARVHIHPVTIESPAEE